MSLVALAISIQVWQIQTRVSIYFVGITLMGRFCDGASVTFCFQDTARAEADSIAHCSPR